jgi:hypothetical protein
MIGPYFFAELTVPSHNCLDMLELFDNVIFQQGGAPAHYANIIMEFLDISTALDWKGRMEVVAPTISGPDTLRFLFLGYM